MDDWTIARYSKNHDRASFRSGEPTLDTFLHTLVNQYEKRGLGRTYVVVEPGSIKIAAYCTLSTGGLEPNQLVPAARKKLPKHQVPVIHLGRLAVDLTYQERGLGELMLFHALRISLDASETMGVFGVTVRALNEKAVAFYARYGFVALADHPSHLLLTMNLIESLFQS